MAHPNPRSLARTREREQGEGRGRGRGGDEADTSSRHRREGLRHPKSSWRLSARGGRRGGRRPPFPRATALIALERNLGGARTGRGFSLHGGLPLPFFVKALPYGGGLEKNSF
eukprot:scaffold228715_cov28-Tisochrysis_lutea.AAC.3